jgi:hypothetical protein
MPMKYFFTLILLFSSALLADDFQIACGNSNGTLLIIGKDDKMTLAANFQDGFSELPVYDGPVTANNISIALNALNDLKELDGSIQVEWDRKLCTQDPTSPFLISCRGEGHIISPAISSKDQTKFQTFSLNTLTETQTTIDMTNERFKINWGVVKNGLQYSMPFGFQKNSCGLKKTN